MDRKTRWKTFWLAALTVASICVLLPSVVDKPSQSLPPWFNAMFNKTIQAGLDLQGGLHIVYSIDLNKAVDDKASELKRDIEARLAEHKPPIEALVTTPATPVGGVTIVPTTPEGLQVVSQEAFLADYDEIVLKVECPEDRRGKALCLRVSSDYADGIRKSALEQAIITVRDRINRQGVSEPSVMMKGEQIIVELPGLDEAKRDETKDLIARTAKLEFKMVDDGQPFMQKLYAQVTKDPEATRLGITGDVDTWVHDDTGKRFTDYLLRVEEKCPQNALGQCSSAPREQLTHDEAAKYGCSDAEPAGDNLMCGLTGRAILERYLDKLAAENREFAIPEDHQIGYELVESTAVDGGEPNRYWRTFYMLRAIELSGSSIAESFVTFNPTTTRPEVLVEFNRYGGRRFGEMTTQNVGKKMAIILDDRVRSAPMIQSKILGGRSTITMGGSDPAEIQREAEDLVKVLKSGSLPAPLQLEQESNVGPLLGRDAVDKAWISFLLGSALVVLIMIVIYRVAGAISILALTLNILFMLAALATLGAVLTLPGIAAVVLTVGMAVDANIIIYERIREELRAGKSIRGAVDAGFSRGFTAILDGQLTTAAAGYVLLQYGSGPIRGFAVMLLIGIACTLFTATWCTRLFFEYYVGKGRKVNQIAI